MPAFRAPRTWRLLHLTKLSYLPCAACGQVHHYLVRVSVVGDCTPVLFPPGIPVPHNIGIEVEAYLAGPTDEAAPGEGQRYHQVAARVRTTSIRCEGCGERFTDLEAYRVHACEVRYR